MSHLETGALEEFEQTTSMPQQLPGIGQLLDAYEDGLRDGRQPSVDAIFEHHEIAMAEDTAQAELRASRETRAHYSTLEPVSAESSSATIPDNRNPREEKLAEWRSNSTWGKLTRSEEEEPRLKRPDYGLEEDDTEAIQLAQSRPYRRTLLGSRLMHEIFEGHAAEQRSAVPSLDEVFIVLEARVDTDEIPSQAAKIAAEAEVAEFFRASEEPTPIEPMFTPESLQDYHAFRSAQRAGIRKAA